MAHFARLDSNNNVVEVVVISNDKLLDNGVESEQKGIDFCNQLFSRDFPDFTYKKTSYNTHAGKYYDIDPVTGIKTLSQDQSKAFRINYAEIGGYYDPVKDGFTENKKYTNWILDPITLTYSPPVPKPNPNDETMLWVFTDNVTGDGYWSNI